MEEVVMAQLTLSNSAARQIAGAVVDAGTGLKIAFCQQGHRWVSSQNKPKCPQCRVVEARVLPILEKPALGPVASEPATALKVPRSWTWPAPTRPSPASRNPKGAFQNEHSALWLCGYRVGKSSPLFAFDRRDILEYFFLTPLPTNVKRLFEAEYGAPGSAERLRKMATVIASNCRNFRRNDPCRYSEAIADYEADLGFLKARFYRPGAFAWPLTV